MEILLIYIPVSIFVAYIIYNLYLLYFYVHLKDEKNKRHKIVKYYKFGFILLTLGIIVLLGNIQTPMGKRTIFNTREAYENADLEQKYDFFFCSSRFTYEDIWRQVNGVQDVQLTYVPVNVGKDLVQGYVDFGEYKWEITEDGNVTKIEAPYKMLVETALDEASELYWNKIRKGIEKLGLLWIVFGLGYIFLKHKTLKAKNDLEISKNDFKENKDNCNKFMKNKYVLKKWRIKSFTCCVAAGIFFEICMESFIKQNRYYSGVELFLLILQMFLSIVASVVIQIMLSKQTQSRQEIRSEQQAVIKSIKLTLLQMVIILSLAQFFLWQSVWKSCSFYAMYIMMIFLVA